MWKKILLGLFLFVCLVGGLGFIKYTQIMAAIEMGAKMAPPPPTVATMEAKYEEWGQSYSAVGTLKASQGVMITAKVDGIVTELHFESGKEVKKGDLILVQDIYVEEAELEGAEATYELTKLDLKRSEELKKNDVIADSAYDKAQADARFAAAQVAAIKARIKDKHIRAPFDGRLGIRQVNLGQNLSVGATVVYLESFDPIYMDFTLPQKSLPNLNANMEVKLKIDAIENTSFTGKISAIEPRIDPSTRQVTIRAIFNNTDKKLLPGMFGQVEVIRPEKNQHITLPTTAIAYNPYGDFVYVIEKGDKGDVAHQVFVETGPSRGNQVAIVKGLKEGQQVVVTGQVKLRNNIPVFINNEILPASDENPKLIDS